MCRPGDDCPMSVPHPRSPVEGGVVRVHTRHIFRKSALPVLAVVISIGGAASSQESTGTVTALKNPVAATPASLSAGKGAYDTNCAGCHGNKAQGAEKAGVVISIIQEQGGKQPPDLTDDKWDHGSTDGEIYTVIKKGVPPTMMAGWDGRISDTEIWSIINYIRALSANGTVTVARTADAPATPRPLLE